MAFAIPDSFSLLIIRDTCVYLLYQFLTTSGHPFRMIVFLREEIMSYLYATMVPLVRGRIDTFKSIKCQRFLWYLIVLQLNVSKFVLKLRHWLINISTLRSPVIMTIIFKSKFGFKFYYLVFSWKTHRRVKIYTP